MKNARSGNGGDGKFLLVGAGVGGWVALLIAKKYPKLVSGVVGMSADPDFTEDLLWRNLDDEDKRVIMEEGVKEIRWGDAVYPISRSLIEDGRNNLILRSGEGKIDVTCPVRLLHGSDDEEVPYATAFKIMSALSTEDVEVTVRKGGKHQLDEEEDFGGMRKAVEEVFRNAKGFDLRSPASG